jgi:purine-binding chemotaxis protein CheW
VRRTWSALDTPILVGPLESRTLAESEGGVQRLADDWPSLLAIARAQRFFQGTVLAADGRSAGIVVELQSIESAPLRDSVRSVLALLPGFEAELGAEIHVAGDPVWTVVSSDTLERDAVVLTALMFAVMGVLLFLLFCDAWFAGLPVLAVGFVTAAVQGIAALAGLPMTRVPLAPPAVRGLMNLRGQVIAGIDLRPCLGLSPKNGEQIWVNIILKGASGPVSLLVDKIGEVATVAEDQFEPPPETLPARIRVITESVCRQNEELILLLDVEQIIRMASDMVPECMPDLSAMGTGRV